MKKGINVCCEGQNLMITREDIELDIITFHQFGIELQETLEGGTNLFAIYDASRVKNDLPGEVKLAMAQWIKDNELLIKNSVCYAVIIVPSFIAQMILKTVLSIRNLPIDYKVFKTETEALAWINKEKEKQ